MKLIRFGLPILVIFVLGFAAFYYHSTTQSFFRHFDLLVTIGSISAYCAYIARQSLPTSDPASTPHQAQFHSTKPSARKLILISLSSVAVWLVFAAWLQWFGQTKNGNSYLGWASLPFGTLIFYVLSKQLQTYRLQASGVSLQINAQFVEISIGQKQKGEIAVSAIESVQPLLARMTKAETDSGRRLGEAFYTTQRGADIPLLLILKPNLSIDKIDWPIELKAYRRRYIQTDAYSSWEREGVVVPGIFADMIAVRQTIESVLHS